jgi:hypothetical protein
MRQRRVRDTCLLCYRQHTLPQADATTNAKAKATSNATSNAIPVRHI